MTQYNPDVPPEPEYRTPYDPNVPPEPGYREERQVQGTDLVGTMKTLVHEGNVRRISIRQGNQIIAEFPLTVGVVGTLLAPWLAAAGAIGALVANCTIEIVRSDQA